MLVVREFKQQQWRRLRKRHLKSDVALLQTLSRLFRLAQFEESRCLLFTSSTKGEITHFHVVVVQ